MVFPRAHRPRQGGAERSHESAGPDVARRTSGSCWTTFPSTSSGSPARRSRAASSSASTRHIEGISSRSWSAYTDCQMLVTSRDKRALLDGIDFGLPDERIARGGRPRVPERWPAEPGLFERPVRDEDLFLLIFTSGSTGLPKAVRCTQGRFAGTGAHVAAGRRAGRAVTSCTRPFPSSTPARSSPAGPRRSPPARPDRHSTAVLGVEHAGRHPALRRHDDDVHGQGPELHPGCSREARMTDEPAAVGDRERGIRP